MKVIKYISFADALAFPIGNETDSFSVQMIPNSGSDALNKASLKAIKSTFELPDAETTSEKSSNLTMKKLIEKVSGELAIQEGGAYIKLFIPKEVYPYLKTATFFDMPDSNLVYQMKYIMNKEEREKKYASMEVAEGTVINAYPQWFTGTSNILSSDGNVNCFCVGFSGSIPEQNTTLKFYSESARDPGSEIVDSSVENALATALSSASNGSSIRMMSGEYTGDFAVNKSLTLVGSYDQNQEDIEEVDSSVPVTKISGTVSVSSDIEIRGVTITADCKFKVSKSSSVKFKNCRFESVTPDAPKTMLITLAKEDGPVRLTVEHCRFKKAGSSGSNAMYHVVEGNAYLASGSSFSHNYVEKGATTHNVFNIYNVAEGATIYVNDNHIEYSGNFCRIGIQGEPKCEIVFDGNSYDETDSAPYSGLILIQPYGKLTTSFKNMTLKIRDTKMPAGNDQLLYMYYGTNDTVITKDILPTIYVDGTKMDPKDIKVVGPNDTYVDLFEDKE